MAFWKVLAAMVLGSILLLLVGSFLAGALFFY